MAQENYIEGCSMQRPPLLEPNGFWFWKAGFETYDNEAKMTLYNALPRKEYKRVFMCKTAKEVWHILIITHQGNSQVKNCKIDLLTQEYEKFSNSNEETIDSGFTRFNAIVTSLKSLDLDHSSKNHKKGYESSRRKRECYNYGNKNHLADNYPKPNNKALVGVSWSDSEDDDETLNDTTCLMAIDSQEVQPNHSTSNNDSNIINLQTENQELLKFRKDFSKTYEKLLQEKHALEKEHSNLFSKVNELELEIKKFASNKEVIEPCQKCVELIQLVDSLKSNVFEL
ncbi:hypothetical protein Tco_1358394 [Tanacetum coccineum]